MNEADVAEMSDAELIEAFADTVTEPLWVDNHRRDDLRLDRRRRIYAELLRRLAHAADPDTVTVRRDDLDRLYESAQYRKSTFETWDEFSDLMDRIRAALSGSADGPAGEEG